MTIETLRVAVVLPCLAATMAMAQGVGASAKTSDASAGAPATDPVAAEPTPPLDLTAAGVRTLHHQVWVSGDFFQGQGYVTMPFKFSLAEVKGLGGFGITPSVARPSRNTDFVGASASYGYNEWLYVDLAYRLGSSSGDADVPLGPDDSALPSKFSISEQWHQAFVRYVPPSQRRKRLQGYIRGGMSYVTAELGDETTGNAAGLYRQTNDTRDILGNLGIGLTYYIRNSGTFRIGLQAEGEGFYGFRDQRSREELPAVNPFPFPTTDISNTLYGGFGRGTIHLEYRFGESQRLRAILDSGMQVNYTIINYPQSPGFNGGDYNELLWGPFVKLGLTYSF